MYLNDSLIDAQRGTALRILAFLETKMSGTSETLPWAQGLKDTEGRAYAMVGIAQALLGMDESKVGRYGHLNSLRGPGW
jgi:hypothetical protein